MAQELPTAEIAGGRVWRHRASTECGRWQTHAGGRPRARGTLDKLVIDLSTLTWISGQPVRSAARRERACVGAAVEKSRHGWRLTGAMAGRRSPSIARQARREDAGAPPARSTSTVGGTGYLGERGSHPPSQAVFRLLQPHSCGVLHPLERGSRALS